MDKPDISNLKFQISNWLLELLFPSFCLGCNTEGVLLCYDCKSTLEISEYQYCLCNKNPMRLPFDTVQGTCSRCQEKKLAGLYTALSYKEKWLTRKLIHQFKYKPYWIQTLAKPLADILLEHFFLIQKLHPEIWHNSVIIPVPMEKGKWKDRGYNQAELLGHLIGQSLNVLSIPNNLVKIKSTSPQMKLNAKDREKNLQGVFAIKNPQAIAGKKVFLIDDVYTTGSTMEACAAVLKEAGAKSVWGIAVARDG